MRWRAAGDHRRVRQSHGESLVVDPVQVSAGDDRAAVEHVEFSRDRLRRGRVIARDHDHVDARVAEFSDGSSRGYPDRVAEGDETGEGQVPDFAGQLVVGFHRVLGHGQDAVAVLGQLA